MAKKTTETKKPVLKKSASKGKITTPVRNSAIPKVTSVLRKSIEITSEMIAVRAYEIHLSGNGGSQTDNWFAAEKQLRGSI